MRILKVQASRAMQTKISKIQLVFMGNTMGSQKWGTQKLVICKINKHISKTSKHISKTKVVPRQCNTDSPKTLVVNNFLVLRKKILFKNNRWMVATVEVISKWNEAKIVNRRINIVNNMAVHLHFQSKRDRHFQTLKHSRIHMVKCNEKKD